MGSVRGMSPSVRLEPMTRDQYDAYRATSEDSYAEAIRDSGSMPEAEAREQAAADYARLLPDGLDSEGHRFWTAYDGDEAVGMLWLRLQGHVRGRDRVRLRLLRRDDLRRQGYGRALMQAAEVECRELGVVSVGLNVFGHNLGAQSLYEQMGFEVTSIAMSKRL